MDYKNIYNKLIENAKSKTRKKGDGEYYENHHITPRCFGGDNKKENLVLLTYREHFLAHLLLIQFYEGKEKSKMSFGLFQMCRKNSQQERIISSRQFEKAKSIMTENCSGENSNFYGRTHTIEVKSELSKKRTGNNNPMYGKIPWNKNKKLPPISDEHKKIISEFNIGRKLSNESKEKISKTHKGKIKSEEHKKKISEKLKGIIRTKESIDKGANKLKNKKQKLLTCPHCGKSGGTTMHRWHFDNCKLKKI